MLREIETGETQREELGDMEKEGLHTTHQEKEVRQQEEQGEGTMF